MKQIITASAKTTTNIIHSLAENIMDATPTVVEVIIINARERRKIQRLLLRVMMLKRHMFFKRKYRLK